MQFKRVKDAYSEKENTVKKYFLHKNLNYQGYKIFLRAFKQERILEVWVQAAGEEHFAFLTHYDFCASSGTVGPKRQEGDRQIPEGVYHITHFNPLSNFHLSLAINYPNKSDRVLGDNNAPGSAIYIHGNCVSVGCIPVSDDKIKELYILCVEAKNNGQEKIPVHIFPTRLSNENLAALKISEGASKELVKFWENLQCVFFAFEDNRTLPPIGINESGLYYF